MATYMNMRLRVMTYEPAAAVEATAHMNITIIV